MFIRKVVYLFKTLFLSQGLPKTLQYLAKPHFSIFLDKSYFEMFVGLPRTCRDLPSLNITKFKTRTNFAMMDDSMLSLSWPLVTCSRGREGWVTVVSIQIPFDTSRFDTTKVDSILILCQFDTNWTRFLIFASHTTAMDRRNVTPEQGMSSQKEKNLVCLEFSELFPLPKYAKKLLWNNPDLKGSQTSLTVEQIVQYKTQTFSIAWQF